MAAGIPSFLSGLTPGAAGIWTLVLMGAVYLIREWRLTRKLTLDDRLARRDGYAAQVTSLTVENRNLRSEMDLREIHHQEKYLALEQKYDRYRDLCEAEAQQHREQIISLMDKVAGLSRTISAYVTAEKRQEGDPA